MPDKNFLDSFFDAAESVMDKAENVLKPQDGDEGIETLEGRREWKCIADKPPVWHSFQTGSGGLSLCGKRFVSGGFGQRLRGKGFVNACVRCMLIEDGKDPDGELPMLEVGDE